MNIANIEKLLTESTPGRWSSSPGSPTWGIDSVSEYAEHWVVNEGLSEENAKAIVALRSIAPDLIAVVKAVADKEPCAIDDDTGYWTCTLCAAHNEHAYPCDVKHANGCAHVLAQRLVNG